MRSIALAILLILSSSLFSSVSTLSSPSDVVCYQVIVGSSASYADVSTQFSTWSQGMYQTLGLQGPIQSHVGYAHVPDRDSFENGCDGPYTTVADLFVHIQATSATYDAISAALEAYIASHPITSLSTISCAARSVVDELPTCGKIPTPTGANPTQPPLPTPADVVCYQVIVGSLQGTYAQVSAALDAWSLKMYNALGLTGPIESHVGHAQVPDRDSFENGCDGPYTTVADLFVHIQTTNANYDAVSAALEAFIAANPLTNAEFAPIDCAARSVTTYLPTCGKQPDPTPTPTPGPNPTQPPADDDTGVVCYQALVGSRYEFSLVASAFDQWSLDLYNTLGLSGPIDTHINYALVPDRSSFEGCSGPYATVADIFVHISTNNYAAVKAALDAFVATPPTLTDYPTIDCVTPSDTTLLPTCGKTPSTPTGANPTQPPVPTPDNVVCYQVIVGSLSGTYDQVSSALYKWSLKMYIALGLFGPIESHVGHAQVPDRDSFENGCNGPYTTVADLFVHIQTTNAEYDAVSAALEAFIAANPLTNAEFAPIDCAARSVTTYLPTCGKTSTPTGANPPQPNGPRSCPVTSYSTSIIDSGAAAASGKRLYTITYDLTNGDADIQYIDIHITTSSGFYNYRMQLSPSATPTSPSYEFVFPEYLALGPGESLSWWFTTAINIPEAPGVWACDSASTSYTTPGTPTGPNPTQAPPSSGVCPVITFNHAVIRTGAGEIPGTGAYAIGFANTSPDRTVEWVDVHLTANGGQFNYRMDVAPATPPTLFPFIKHLLSPHLDLTPGTSISYWFTYESQGIACDTQIFSFIVTIIPE